MTVTRLRSRATPPPLALGADRVAARARRGRAARGRSTLDDRPHRLARPVLARAAGRGRDARAGRIAYGPVDAGRRRRACSTPACRRRRRIRCASAGPRTSLPRRQTRLTFARCGIVDPLSAEDYRAHGGYRGPRARARRSSGERRSSTRSKLSGLRGRGGAGFPTGIKWNTVCSPRRDQKYVVCNADEGDSGTFADRMLMEGDPFCADRGHDDRRASRSAPRKGFIYIRSEYPHAFRDHARGRSRPPRAAGYLGAVGAAARAGRSRWRRGSGAGAYICGEETSLLESLEGKRGMVRAKPPLPAIKGLFGKPTVVNNVLSLATVPWILANGAQGLCGFRHGPLARHAADPARRQRQRMAG